MTKRILISLFIACLLTIVTARAQMTPWLLWTLLPQEQMAEIIGEASGETAWNTIMETGGYNKDRQTEEYAGTFYETQYIYDQLKLYGLPGAEIVRFPGRKVWDAIQGELWEISPMRQKLASYKDMTAMLASGSATVDVKGELVWVGRGTKEEIQRANVGGKVVVTEGSISNVHNEACVKQHALGVIALSSSRSYYDPYQIPWRGIRRRRRTSDQTPKFGFHLPVREGEFLRRRLLRGEKITVHARVQTKMEPYELQDIVCHIPGTDPNAGEIIFSAHLFEGIVKQGANDNKSGSAGILEVARTLHTLIEEGRLPRPKRTIRFLWGPEFSGTGPWVKDNKEIMEKTLCNINMDMVGEWLSKNRAFMCLMRTTYGNPHYINDVMENYYRFVGEGNRERIQNRRGVYRVPHRIVAPSGADEPFYYSIETHYGASDHVVFNDWGVQVPGVMMIAWPDPWYHTSGDRVDKSDPTQMKRVAIIGAAAAYTVASADDNMAIKIAGEITSNGTRRLGHQLVVGLEILNGATAENLSESYKKARTQVEAAIDNEKETLETVLELAEDKKTVASYIAHMQKTVDMIGKSHLTALKTHMEAVAEKLGVKPVKVLLTELERKASKLIPKPTAKVKMNGYGGYRIFIIKVPKEERAKYPYTRRDIANTRELHLLINGKRSVLGIKNVLDAQHQRESKLQAVLNYIEILKLAGLVEMQKE
ncbi:MAG: M28 family peptidase [Candidatus Aminicenantes bacterium]|nr:MAG: M28 family peptidase [Candidatus Aminicenantes bacterium]